MMVKAVRVMLEPNNVQQTKMFQYAGAARFAYNWALAKERITMKKVASSFRIQSLEKNLQGLGILLNTRGYKMFPIM